MNEAAVELATRIDGDPRGRMYRVPSRDSFSSSASFEIYPSMTNVLKVTPKHNPLMAWAAKLERAYTLDKATTYWKDKGCVPTVNQFDHRFGKMKAHRGALEKARDIGTEAHGLIELWMKSVPVGTPGEVLSAGDFSAAWCAAPVPSQRAFNAWRDWQATVGLEPVLVEKTVWSHEMRVAGTMDLFAKLTFGNARCYAVCDWKTSNGLYIEHRIQIAGYRKALIDMGLADENCLGLVLRLSKNKPRKGVALFEPHVLMPSECRELAKVIPHLRAVWEFLTANGQRL